MSQQETHSENQAPESKVTSGKQEIDLPNHADLLHEAIAEFTDPQSNQSSEKCCEDNASKPLTTNVDFPTKLPDESVKESNLPSCMSQFSSDNHEESKEDSFVENNKCDPKKSQISDVQSNPDAERAQKSSKLKDTNSSTNMLTSNENKENEIVSESVKVLSRAGEMVLEKPKTEVLSKPMDDCDDKDLSFISESQNVINVPRSNIEYVCNVNILCGIDEEDPLEIPTTVHQMSTEKSVDSQDSVTGQKVSKSVQRQKETGGMNSSNEVPTLSQFRRREYNKFRLKQSNSPVNNRKSVIELRTQYVLGRTKLSFEGSKKRLEAIIVNALQDIVNNVEDMLKGDSTSVQEDSAARIIPRLESSLSDVEVTVHSVFEEVLGSTKQLINKVIFIVHDLVENKRVNPLSEFTSIAGRVSAVIDCIKYKFNTAEKKAYQMLEVCRISAENKVRRHRVDAQSIAKEAVGEISQNIDILMEVLEHIISHRKIPTQCQLASQDRPLCLQQIKEESVCESVSTDDELEVIVPLRFCEIKEVVLSALMEAEFTIFTYITDIQSSFQFVKPKGCGEENESCTTNSVQGCEASEPSPSVENNTVSPKMDQEQNLCSTEAVSVKSDVSLPEDISEADKMLHQPIATSSPSRTSDRNHDTEYLLENSATCMNVSQISSENAKQGTSEKEIEATNSSMSVDTQAETSKNEVCTAENVSKTQDSIITEIDDVITEISQVVRGSINRVERCLRSSLKEIEAANEAAYDCSLRESNETIKKLKDVAEDLVLYVNQTLQACYQGHDKDKVMASAAANYRHLITRSPPKLSKHTPKTKTKCVYNIDELEKTPVRRERNEKGDTKFTTPENSCTQISSYSLSPISTSGSRVSISSVRANASDSPVSSRFNTYETLSISNTENNSSTSTMPRSTDSSFSSKSEMSQKHKNTPHSSKQTNSDSGNRRRLDLQKLRRIKIGFEKEDIDSTLEVKTVQVSNDAVPVRQSTPKSKFSTPSKCRSSEKIIRVPNSIEKAEQFKSIVKFSTTLFGKSSSEIIHEKVLFCGKKRSDLSVVEFSGVSSENTEEASTEKSTTAVKTPPNSLSPKYTTNIRLSTGSRRLISKSLSSKLSPVSPQSTFKIASPMNILKKMNEFPEELSDTTQSDSGSFCGKKQSELSVVVFSEVSSENTENVTTEKSTVAARTPPNSISPKYAPNMRLSTGSRRYISKSLSSKLSPVSLQSTSIISSPMNILKKMKVFPEEGIEYLDPTQTDSGGFCGKKQSDLSVVELSGVSSEKTEEASTDKSTTAVKTPPNSVSPKYAPNTPLSRLNTGCRSYISKSPSDTSQNDSGSCLTTSTGEKHFVKTSAQSLTRTFSGDVSCSTETSKTERDSSMELESGERIVRSDSSINRKNCNENIKKIRRSLNFDDCSIKDAENAEGTILISPRQSSGVSNLDNSSENNAETDNSLC
ncbi:hypothetical protein C0J52_25949 [Blattella germanica]|nr:hypothetical protein C0J52_25949 [Blattella germanica]